MMRNLLLLLLGPFFSAAKAILTFRDISGNYTLQWVQHHALTDICTLNLRLALTNGALSGENMFFDNKTICHGSAGLESVPANKGLESAAFDNKLVYKKASGHDPELTCDGKGMTWAWFFYTEHHSFVGATTKFKYEKNGVYLFFYLDFGTMRKSCVYRRKGVPDEHHETPTFSSTNTKHSGSGKELSETPLEKGTGDDDRETPKPLATGAGDLNGKADSKNPPVTDSKRDESKTAELWAWLGPVLGTIGTIVGALITVFCVSNRENISNSQTSFSIDEEGLAF